MQFDFDIRFILHPELKGVLFDGNSNIPFHITEHLVITNFLSVASEKRNCNSIPGANWPNILHSFAIAKDGRKSLKIVPRSLIERKRKERSLLKFGLQAKW